LSPSTKIEGFIIPNPPVSVGGISIGLTMPPSLKHLATKFTSITLLLKLVIFLFRAKYKKI
jgi:hypothetical protein